MPFKDYGGSSVVAAASSYYFDPYPLVQNENRFVGATQELAETARDDYFANNSSVLLEYNADPLRMISVEWELDGTEMYQVQTYFQGNWISFAEGLPTPLEVKTLLEANADTGTVTDGEKLVVSDLLTVTDGKLPYMERGRAVTSPYRVTDKGAFVQGTAYFEGGTLGIGTVVSASDYGGFLGLSNAIDGNRYRIPDFRVSEGSASYRIRRLADTEGLTTVPITTVTDTELDSPLSFNYTITSQATTLAIEIQASEPLVDLRLKITNVSPDNLGVPIKYWPSEADWLDDTGATLDVGTQTIDFRASPLPFSEGRTINIEAKYSSGKVLGDVSGIPAFSALLQEGRWIESQDALEEVSATIDGDTFQMLANQSVSVTLDSNGTLLLPEQAVSGDIALLQKITFSGGTKLSIANTDNSFLYVHSSLDGSVTTDVLLETSIATPRKFKYMDGGWSIFI